MAKSKAEQQKQDVELAEVWSDPPVEEIGSTARTLSNKAHLRELATLQVELVKQLTFTDIKRAPWYVVNADNRKRARLNVIHHLLSLIPYEDLTPEPIVLPPRHGDSGYVRPPMADQTFVPEVYGTRMRSRSRSAA